jgi:hypothetical protein
MVASPPTKAGFRGDKDIQTAQRKMSKWSVTLSKEQMVLYRPESEQGNTTLCFAEKMSLFPANAPTATLLDFLMPQLEPSLCTTDGVQYLADELCMRPEDLRAPQILLLLSMIKEYGGGHNNGKIVLDVDAKLPPSRRRRKKIRARRCWREYGHEPPNLAKQRVGEGVGGGMTKMHIWDLKKRPPEKQAERVWTMATTLASSAPLPSTTT